MTREEEIEAFKKRWHEADDRGESGHRVEQALAPLLDELFILREKRQQCWCSED